MKSRITWITIIIGFALLACSCKFTMNIPLQPPTEEWVSDMLTSAVNENISYYLLCSEPAGGLMQKVLLKTDDGGMSYQTVGDISTLVQNYVVAFAFADESSGLILVSYHGCPEYAYMTKDGGTNWDALTLVKNLEEGQYVNGVAVEAIQNGYHVTLEVVGENTEQVMYESHDFGTSWNQVDIEK